MVRGRRALAAEAGYVTVTPLGNSGSLYSKISSALVTLNHSPAQSSPVFSVLLPIVNHRHFVRSNEKLTVRKSEEDGEEIRFEGVMKEGGVDLKTVAFWRVVFDCRIVGRSGRENR